MKTNAIKLRLDSTQFNKKVIRSKVPTTKQEFGDNYIAVGPLNEAFIRTEVEVREPDIGALRRAINEMRNRGVNVT